MHYFVRAKEKENCNLLVPALVFLILRIYLVELSPPQRLLEPFGWRWGLPYGAWKLHGSATKCHSMLRQSNRLNKR